MLFRARGVEGLSDRMRIWGLQLKLAGRVARKLSPAPRLPYFRCPRVLAKALRDVETGMVVGTARAQGGKQKSETRERRTCGQKRDTLARGAGAASRTGRCRSAAASRRQECAGCGYAAGTHHTVAGLFNIVNS